MLNREISTSAFYRYQNLCQTPSIEKVTASQTALVRIIFFTKWCFQSGSPRPGEFTPATADTRGTGQTGVGARAVVTRIQRGTFCSPGNSDDLPVHAGWSQSGRLARSQAGTHPPGRQKVSRQGQIRRRWRGH